MERSYVLSCVLVLCLASYAWASCARVNKCCQGRDNSCVSQGPRLHQSRQKLDEQAIIKDVVNCYCDAICKHLGDCCHDHATHCPPIDCELGDWGDWGHCSEECGVGVMTRTRPVLRASRNGGKECDVIVQQGRCEGQNCKVPRHLSAMQEARETAKIIPASYGSWRESKLYNPFKDIRSNLYNHYYKEEQHSNRPNYCAHFEVVRTSKGCQADGFSRWAESLREGTRVCVECQSQAMSRKLGLRCRGHGVLERTTRWHALVVHGCHGEWIMKTKHEECSCDPNNANSFIFI